MIQKAITVRKRFEILDVIAVDWKRKPEIVDRTPNARTTVDRGIDELRQHDLVERRDSSYRATGIGRHHLECYRQLLADAEVLFDARDLLYHLNDGEQIPPAVLRDADIDRIQPHMPDTVANGVIENVREADYVRFCASVQLGQYVENNVDQLMAGELEIVSIYDPGRWNAVVNEYGDEYIKMFEHDDLRGYITDSLPSYTLGCFRCSEREWMGILVHTDTGLQATVINDSESAVNWAKRKLDDIQSSARRLCPLENGPYLDTPG